MDQRKLKTFLVLVMYHTIYVNFLCSYGNGGVRTHGTLTCPTGLANQVLRPSGSFPITFLLHVHHPSLLYIRQALVHHSQ